MPGVHAITDVTGFGLAGHALEMARGAKLRALIDWVGVDRLLFASDYPHGDCDDPRLALKTPLTEIERAKIFNGNARALYQLG